MNRLAKQALCLLSHVASLGHYCIEETLAMAIASSPQHSELQESMVAST